MKLFNTICATAVIGSAMVMSGTASANDRDTGRGTGPIVYVTSQGLYYDSIVLTDLPAKGPFQQLIPGENGLSTEFGPGGPGHHGGRWWIDVNSNGEMDAEDKYFLCPLLGPGRETM